MSSIGSEGRRVMKQWAKRAARPVTGRLFARVDARVAPISEQVTDVARKVEPLASDVAGIRDHFAPAMARLQTHDKLTAEHAAAIHDMAEQLNGLNEYLPIVLNNLSSQNAAHRELRRTELELREALSGLEERLPSFDDLAHVHKRLDELGSVLAERIAAMERRAEFMRSEILFETRYGGRANGVTSSVESRVVAADKLASFGGDIRLNLGCGHIPLEGFLNVDARPLDGVDVVGEVGALPFEPGSIVQIHSAHLLEHFPVEDLRRRLIPYWFRLLRPGGVFSAVVPDSEKMIEEFAAGRYSFDDLRLVTYGEQEYDGDFHFNMFSQQSLYELLETAGFTEVTIVESGRRNGACYEMEVRAVRPGGHG